MINIIPSKIKTKPLGFQLTDQLSTDLLVQSFNYVPYIFFSKINDTETNPQIDGTNIDPRDITYVKLFNSTFLPEIEILCDDSKGILFNDLYPFDHDTLISIFVKANSENVMPIRMDFRLTEYETIKANENSNSHKYLMKGILDVDELHYTRYESFRGTSYNTIKDIALKIGLGFASNVTESDDEMTWINPGDTYREFIKDITRYSYISDESFVWTFIDFYYNLNYINIQKEMNEFIITGQPLTNKQVVKNDEEINVPLYLTNNTAFNMTNKYISKFNIINQSFKVNLEKFYKMKGTWYDKNDNTVYKKDVPEFETDQAKLGNSEGSIRQLSDKTSPIYYENTNDEYFISKMDTTNNVHKNYSFAKVLNQYNLDSLEKMKMVIILNQTNLSIKRFQNIKVEIYNIQDVLSKNATVKTALNNINERLSGYWYVTGINYLYRRNGGPEQEITLMRRDLSLNYGQSSDSKNDMRKLTK